MPELDYSKAVHVTGPNARPAGRPVRQAARPLLQRHPGPRARLLPRLRPRRRPVTRRRPRRQLPHHQRPGRHAMSFGDRQIDAGRGPRVGARDEEAPGRAVMSRSHAEIRADLEHPHTAALLAVRASVGDAPIGRLLRDVGPLVDALAAVERERDQLREAWNDAAERANKASARADAALARIAAIEAERDEALATIAEWGDYAENLSEMRARIAAVEALIGDCAGHLHIPAEVRACPYCRIRASLAASPTPTGPKPTWLTTDCGRCDNERRAKLPWPERLSQRMILCPDCGSKRCPRAAFHGNACDRDIGPATPEPTEETP